MPRVLASGGCGATTRPPQRMLSVMSSPPCLKRGRVSGRDLGYCSLSTSTKIRSKGPGTPWTTCKASPTINSTLWSRRARTSHSLANRAFSAERSRARWRPSGGSAPAPDEPGELCQKPSHNRTDDREVTRLGELLHLREDGIPVRNEAVKVGLDLRSEHL